MENMLLPISSTELIASSDNAVDAIKTAAGLTDTQFTALCIPVLRAYADHVQRLPLSAAAFTHLRGAWEFGLTAAMVAYRYASTLIFFPALGAEERRMLEPQCRYMAFLATLSTAVATVAEASSLNCGDNEYHPLSVEGTLARWLSEHPTAKFTWRTQAAPLSAQANAAIAANFVPKRLLANFDLRAVLMMYEAINPKTTMNGVESTLARVVRQATQGVLDHNRAEQAGTFIPEANSSNVSTVEANKVADKLIAVANPTILANPLEKAAATRDGAAQPPAPSDTTQPTASAPPSGSIQASSTPAAAPVEPVAAQLPDIAQTAGGATNEGEEKLARANKVLREWFSALKQHPQFHVLKDQLVMTNDGIEVPVSMLGMFGVSGATIRKMMDDAGLILGRSSNARGVILHPGLRDRFISQ